MVFSSIKWKLTLSLAALSVAFAGFYALLVKNTFESDKTAAVIDSQNRQANLLARNIDQQVQRALFDARAVTAGFRFSDRRLEPATQNIFWNHPQLLALEIKRPGEEPLTLEKFPNLLSRARTMNPGAKKSRFKSLGADKFALALNEFGADGLPQSLKIVFIIKDVLGSTSERQITALVDDREVIERRLTARATQPETPLPALARALVTTKPNPRQKIGGKNFLLAAAPLEFGGLKLLVLSEERAVMGGLDTLFNRSILFLLFTICAGLGVSLLLSNLFTRHFGTLINNTEKYARGEFNVTNEFKPNDEVGRLSNALEKMGRDLQALLINTKTEASLQNEKRATELAQNNLFPDHPTYANGQIRLCGWHRSAQVADGDWWFYLQRGSELFVAIADGTGHGIDQSLLMAASRATFASIVSEDFSLKTIARDWDRAIHQCSNGTVKMTALLLQINVELGDIRMINAGHPPLLVLRKEGITFRAESIPGHQNHALGESREGWLEDLLELNAGDRLFMFSDGLLQLAQEAGYFDQKFSKLLTANLSPDLTPDSFTSMIARHLAGQRGATAVGDATLITIDFKAKNSRI